MKYIKLFFLYILTLCGDFIATVGFIERKPVPLIGGCAFVVVFSIWFLLVALRKTKKAKE